ncbi:MAG TPA: class I SAM-dependent methyltransferase [Nitrospiraceae bacterium]|nr:class I SAM-dependent methyltransferase [Nitrospiraceae bacterium]
MYAKMIFPLLMDWLLGRKFFLGARQDLLENARGLVVEIGFGTGLNIPHYPPGIIAIRAVDPVRLLPGRLARRMAKAPFPVSFAFAAGEDLPFPSQHFDSAISTFTLCTVRDPIAALREVKRVLKPGGRFLFLEHGRSDSPAIARWQDRLNPIQQVVGCGCNLNRPIDRLVKQAGLSLERLGRDHVPGTPRMLGELYRGIASRRDD